MELIQQGAEARIYRSDFLGKPCIIKERFVKKYRINQLDESLSLQRIRAEFKGSLRARAAGMNFRYYIL